jgi:glycerol kinase
MVMKSLEQQGRSTSAIRNRRRRRKAVNRPYHVKVQQHAETPALFNCCAAGLAFGAFTDDDDRAYREYQRQQYEARLTQQQKHEDKLRRKYLREHGLKEANQIINVMKVRN